MSYDGVSIRQWAGESQWRAWRADLAHYRHAGVNPFDRGSFWALTVYRLQRFARGIRPKIVGLPIRAALSIIRRFVLVLTRVDLCPYAEIGPGLVMLHGGPIVVGLATMGADCSLFQMTTIGAGPKPGNPQIGDHVLIGCHSCVLGGVIVGDHAKIGAGAVVVKDIPAGATAVGVPAKVLRTDAPSPIHAVDESGN